MCRDVISDQQTMKEKQVSEQGLVEEENIFSLSLSLSLPAVSNQINFIYLPTGLLACFALPRHL